MEGILFIAATNKPMSLPANLLRRLEVKVLMMPPNEEESIEILVANLKKIIMDFSWTFQIPYISRVL